MTRIKGEGLGVGLKNKQGVEPIDGFTPFVFLIRR